MNKKIKVTLATLGAADVLFTLFTPIAIAWLWGLKFGFDYYGSYVIMGLAFMSSIYRAIHIGWLKE